MIIKVIEIFSIGAYILEIAESRSGYYYYTIITPIAEVWTFGDISLTAEAAEREG